MFLAALESFRKGLLFLVTVFGITALAGCSQWIQKLRPIPQPTWPAPTISYPITNEQDAVNAARGMADTAHFDLVGEVKTVSVQEMKLVEANKLVHSMDGNNFEDRPPDSKVWLVQFISWVRIQPPPGPSGPTSPIINGPSCTYVMFQADGQEGMTVSGSDCPKDVPPISIYEPTSTQLSQ